MGLLSRHKKEKRAAEEFYARVGDVRCPYFNNQSIVFNSDGFNHLQFSAGKEREKSAQILKFVLLKHAPGIIRKSGTIQEYRKQWGCLGRKKRDGTQQMKEMEYWGLSAIVPDEDGNSLKVKVILRRVGDGNITFWSVMKGARDNTTYRLADGNISDD
jgi:hypothetical protein